MRLLSRIFALEIHGELQALLAIIKMHGLHAKPHFIPIFSLWRISSIALITFVIFGALETVHPRVAKNVYPCVSKGVVRQSLLLQDFHTFAPL